MRRLILIAAALAVSSAGVLAQPASGGQTPDTAAQRPGEAGAAPATVDKNKAAKNAVRALKGGDPAHAKVKNAGKVGVAKQAPATPAAASTGSGQP